MLAVSLFAVSLLSTAVVAQKCYSLDGQALDDSYQPCNPKAKFSSCCALNGTDPGNNDICLDSGLCQSTSGWYAGFLWANGCTDPTGKDDACPKVCSGVPEQYNFNVLQCNPGTFCCRAGYDKTNCCNSNQTVIQTSHIGSLLLPGTDSVVNTSYYAPSTANNSSTTCPTDHTAAVGGAVGGVLGAALITSLVALAFVLRNRKNLRSEVANVKGQRDAALQSAADEKAMLQQQHQQQLAQQMQMQQQQYPMAAPMYQAPLQPYQPSGPFGGTYTPNSGAPMSPPSQVSTLHSPPTEVESYVRPVEMDTQRHPSELSDGVERVKELPKTPGDDSTRTQDS